MFELYGNTAHDIIFASVVIFLFIGFGTIMRTVLVNHIVRMAKGTKTKIDDFFLVVVRSFGLRFYIILGFLVTLLFVLTLPESFRSVLNHLFVIFIVFEVVLVCFRAVDFAMGEYAKRLDSGALTTALPALSMLMRALITVFGLIFVLSNLGVNVTALLAGLGVAGLAISFAFQKILADLFSTFVIFFDRPFAVGDMVSVDGVSGTVEKVGIKTTDVRAFTGERIVVPNEDLVSTKIYNTTDRAYRKATLHIPVSYDTKNSKLDEISVIIQSIVASHKKAQFVHARMSEFGEHAIMFEVVYKVNTINYAEYVGIRHAVHREVLDRFDDAGIRLGYPIQAISSRKR